MNLALGTNIVTGHGFTNASDFDLWKTATTTTGPGQPKISGTEPSGVFDHVMIVWRNYGLNNQGFTDDGSPGTLLGHTANTYSVFYAHEGIPINIMRHEFSHLLYGGNNFHTAGGGESSTYGEYFITYGDGWSNMSLANGSLVTWNGWDRQRMGWYGHTNGVANTFLVSARNSINTAEVNGDLDASSGTNATYTLRDFVGTGDAIRIKLPFTDPNSEYPEFLWVENHQSQALNGNPFDRWQHQTDPCVLPMVPGLQMYVQIDKEVRQAGSAAELYNSPGDHIRPLDASGHADQTFDFTTPPNFCVSWNNNNPATVQGLPNPFTGTTDRHWVAEDFNANGSLTHGERRLNFTELVNGVDHDNLFYLGHTRQVFTPGGNHKVGIGTNPSSATMMNKVGFNSDVTPNKNLRRIYLNGVSVELLQQNANGSINVKVRYDDVDVTYNTRWCADEIQLNPVVTGTGYSLNVTAGKTVTLDQGTTATRRDAPVTYNGQQIFVSPTLMRCPATTWLNLAPNSGFTVDNGSTLRLENGSRMDIGNGAVLRVKRGGKLELMGGSSLNIMPGGQVIIEESNYYNAGTLVFYPNARINMEAANSVLEIAGKLVIKENATFTTSRSGDPNTTYGLLKFTSQYNPSINVFAEPNTRFILKSTNTANKILSVQQESLYGPENLLEFSLRKGTAIMGPNARIVPSLYNGTSINFVNAVVTSSTGVRNTHRGVWLLGQSNLVLNASTFSKGIYGVYSTNNWLGTSPNVLNCKFLDCNVGFYNYDKGINALDCSFDDCSAGLQCLQMSQTSWLKNCTAQNNTGTGVSFQGTSVLNVVNPALDGNAVGLDVDHATAKVSCGSVSYNGKTGFLVQNGATLRMDGISMGAHDPVTAIENAGTIRCMAAENVYLDLGGNSLRPVNSGSQASLYGTFLCQPYGVQSAKYNNWNGSVGTVLTSAEYAITACGTPVIFSDLSSSSETTCGQADIVAGGGSGEMVQCLDCGTVETLDGTELPLDEASAQALAYAENDSLQGNEKLAMDAFHAILMSDLQAPSADAIHMLNYDYNYLKESYSDGLEKQQLIPDLDNTEMGAYLTKMAEVQDARIAAVEPDGDGMFAFFTSIDRAQTARAAGRLDEAITILNSMPVPVDSAQQAYHARILCYTQIELGVRNGTLGWDEMEGALAVCGGGQGLRSLEAIPMDEATISDDGIQIRPNPAKNQLWITGLGEGVASVRIRDAMGRVVFYAEQVKENGEVALSRLTPGLYTCQIMLATGGGHVERLVVE
ncbi:MAG: right-handed parallel beta-helix repeat-containing protein [Flavobacteriales bacterium]